MTSNFRILGSGAGHTNANRNSSSYLLEYKNRLSLFDCGSGSVSSLLRMGYDPLCIDNIFISHMHIDHIGDLLLHIQKQYLLKRDKPLNIYMPSEGINTIEKYMKACYLFREKFIFELSFVPMEPMISLYNDKVTILPIANRHLFKSIEAIEKNNIGDMSNQMQSFSFKIEIESKTLLYTADIESLDDIEEYLDNIILLVIETSHIDLEQLVEISANRNVEKTVLTHIDENSESVVKALSERNPDRFVVAEDGLIFDL